MSTIQDLVDAVNALRAAVNAAGSAPPAGTTLDVHDQAQLDQAVEDVKSIGAQLAPAPAPETNVAPAASADTAQPPAAPEAAEEATASDPPGDVDPNAQG